jgi:hypothetical protein
MEAAMRLLILVTLLCVSAAPAYANLVVDPAAPWPQRINPCAAAWHEAAPEKQGTMSYRQFITKCVGGKTALPLKTKAVCEDNTTSNGDAPQGACAQNGGVADWLN